MIHRRIWLLSAFLPIAILTWSGRAAAAPILPGSGFVTFEQIDFRPDSSSKGANSSVGQVTVASSLGTGFLNVADGSGNWLVRNLPMISSWGVPTSTTRFNLGVPDGQDVTSMLLSVDFSTDPLTAFSGSSFWSFGIGSDVFAAGGVDVDLVGFVGAPNMVALPAFSDLLPTFDVNQTGHPNVQAARNQCAPAAVANSLQFLENEHGLNVPNNNVKGTRNDVPNTSLVGVLEQDMGRAVTSRKAGSGVWPFDGKLKYIDDNKLPLSVQHIGDGDTGGVPSVALNGAANVTRHNLTSAGQGATVTWDWIIRELSAGEDVEIDLHYRKADGTFDGRHYVNVVGAGMILGIPYIRHISDHAQTDVDPTDTRGTGFVDFEFMIGDFVFGSNAIVDQGISESVPEPGAILLVAPGILALYRYRRRNRHEAAD